MNGRALALLSLAWGFSLAGCDSGSGRDPANGEISFHPDRPPTFGPGVAAPAYTGSDAFVLQATSTYVTGMDLHQKLVLRTCGGVNGVCHNAKEYPDLHTLATFTEAIGAPCNLQSGTYQAIFDRCELPGDLFDLNGLGTDEVGWLNYVQGPYVDYSQSKTPPPADAAGVHLWLHDPVPGTDDRIYGTGEFIRQVLDVDGIRHRYTLVGYTTQYWILGDRRHVFAEVQDYQLDQVQSVLDAKIEQGDANRNGIYGYATGRWVSLLSPGKPEESYLVARLRGQMQGETIPGTRMPLANQPPSVVDMLALMCFIEHLRPSGASYNLADGIDYQDCSYSANPQALNVAGQGVTFSGRIAPLLASNCGGCHGATNPAGSLDLVSTGLHDRLLLASVQQPAKPLISPGNPVSSYLYLKITGDGSITGKKMPLTASGTPGQLADADVQAISTWISAGALND